MSCCSPDRDDAGPERAAPTVSGAISEAADPTRRVPVVQLAGGRFRMGTEGPATYPEEGEDHLHEVEVDGFEIDTYAVSNDRFAEFAAGTGFVTDAERYQWSFVFGG